MRAAVASMAADQDKSANLDRCRALVERAARDGATLVVLPEAAMYDFGDPQLPLAPAAEPLDGPFVSALSRLADEHSVMVVAGMFEPDATDPTRAYNTVVALAPDGMLAGSYRKQHLFDAMGWKESDRLLPGAPDQRLVLDCGDLRVGVMTCYDLRFPELARALVDDGATVLALPAAWVAGPGKVRQWETLLAARAIENVSYVLAAGQAPARYSGHSVVLDPLGQVLASVDTDGVAVADLDAERVASARVDMPSLHNRRWSVTPREATLPLSPPSAALD